MAEFEGRKLRDVLKELSNLGEPLYIGIIGSTMPLLGKLLYQGEDFIALETSPGLRTIVPLIAISGFGYDPDLLKADAWFKDKFVGKGSVPVDEAQKPWAERFVISGKLLPGTAPGTYRRP